MEFKKKETKKNLLRNAMIEFEKPLRNLCRSNSLKVNIGLQERYSPYIKLNDQIGQITDKYL